MKPTFLLPLLLSALLSACMAPAPVLAPVPTPVPAAMPAPMGGAMAPVPGAPYAAPEPVVGVAGLTERKPDLCGASKNYASAIGQPGSIIPSLGVTNDYRVVEYRGIEPQDYVPSRVVFRLDAAGIITNVDCG